MTQMPLSNPYSCVAGCGDSSKSPGEELRSCIRQSVSTDRCRGVTTQKEARNSYRGAAQASIGKGTLGFAAPELKGNPFNCKHMWLPLISNGQALQMPVLQLGFKPLDRPVIHRLGFLLEPLLKRAREGELSKGSMLWKRAGKAEEQKH